MEVNFLNVTKDIHRKPTENMGEIFKAFSLHQGTKRTTLIFNSVMLRVSNEIRYLDRQKERKENTHIILFIEEIFVYIKCEIIYYRLLD